MTSQQRDKWTVQGVLAALVIGGFGVIALIWVVTLLWPS